MSLNLFNNIFESSWLVLESVVMDSIINQAIIEHRSSASKLHIDGIY